MLEAIERAGGTSPALESRPDIEGLEWLWLAFSELGTCRGIGMTLGPIPWMAIDRYSQANEMTPFETRMLHRVIRRMDSEYLNYLKTKNASKKPKKKGRGPRRA